MHPLARILARIKIETHGHHSTNPRNAHTSPRRKQAERRRRTLPIQATVQPASAPFLQLQITRALSASRRRRILPSSSTRLPVQDSARELSPSPHRRMRRNHPFSIINPVLTQNRPQIQRLIIPRGNHNQATLSKQQSIIPVGNALSHNLVIDAIPPQQPPLAPNRIIIDRPRAVKSLRVAGAERQGDWKPLSLTSNYGR